MSTQPIDTPTPDERQPMTLPDLVEMKRAREPIVMVTAYDYPSAQIVDEAGVDSGHELPPGPLDGCVVVAVLGFALQVSGDSDDACGDRAPLDDGRGVAPGSQQVWGVPDHPRAADPHAGEHGYPVAAVGR